MSWQEGAVNLSWRFRSLCSVSALQLNSDCVCRRMCYGVSLTYKKQGSTHAASPAPSRAAGAVRAPSPSQWWSASPALGRLQSRCRPHSPRRARPRSTPRQQQLALVQQGRRLPAGPAWEDCRHDRGGGAACWQSAMFGEPAVRRQVQRRKQAVRRRVQRRQPAVPRLAVRPGRPL